MVEKLKLKIIENTEKTEKKIKITLEKLLRTAVQSKDSENEIKKRIEKYSMLEHFTQEEIINIIKDEKRKILEEKSKN